jgi:hypothetical protein
MAERIWVDSDLNEIHPVEAINGLLQSIDDAGDDRDKLLDALTASVVSLLRVERARVREAEA